MSSRRSQHIQIPEPSIREFAYINRYWDKSRNSISAKILPGEFYVTLDDEYITTVLGSCVSACIRDRVFGIGGMNHFMLPEIFNETEHIPVNNSESARYGNYAMEHMINTILKHGGRRENLEVKIVGGGRIIANMANIGDKNIAFVRRYLQTEGMKVVAEDVGDIYPRKVVYHPISGKVRVKKMRSMHNDTIRAREQRYMKDLDKGHVSGDVELFD
jgi:chemotaxis protein CheD